MLYSVILLILFLDLYLILLTLHFLFYSCYIVILIFIFIVIFIMLYLYMIDLFSKVIRFFYEVDLFFHLFYLYFWLVMRLDHILFSIILLFLRNLCRSLHLSSINLHFLNGVHLLLLILCQLIFRDHIVSV